MLVLGRGEQRVLSTEAEEYNVFRKCSRSAWLEDRVHLGAGLG